MANISGQIRLNEACSSNNDIIEDEDSDSPDWVELYNYGSLDVDLEGYFLTDKKNDTTKWMFGDITLNGETYLLVFCSGKDRPQGASIHTSFKISQDGETLWLYSPSKILVDSIRVPYVSTDLSYGSYPNGTETTAFFSSPTPGGSNDFGNPSDHIIAYKPIVNPEPGIYSSRLEISMSTQESDAEIRYTLNGRIPDSESLLYTGPFDIWESVVVTARAFKDGLIDSYSTTSNYVFMNEQHLPVVCLSTHPGYFFNEDTGIYVLGPNASPDFPYLGANFWSDTEVPVTVQWFDNYGKLGFEQVLGARIHGGSVSRTRPMRSLRLLADDKYGKDEIDYSLFTTKTQPTNKRFLLRNSGSDYLKTMLRDGMSHNLFIEEQLHVDAVSYRPVEVYLNGDFWGIHNVREKLDRYYLQYNYGVDDDNVDMLEEQDLVMEGNFLAFDFMEESVLTMDLSDQANFDLAASMFDTENMADYYITQTYINNLDWPYNNLKYWRERIEDAKWRYIIFDLDATLGGVSFAPVEFDSYERAFGEFGDDNRHIVLFRKFLENQTYFEYFINRYCDLVNTTFSPARFTDQLEKEKALIEPVIEKHFDRWDGEIPEWNEEIAKVDDYINERPPYAISQLQAFYELEQQSNIHLNVYPPSAGTIDLNSVSLRKFPFSGVYFEDIQISITAIENPGFVFSHWESNRGDILLKSSSNVFQPIEGDSLTAVFVGKSTYTPLDVYPNPSFGSINVDFVNPRKQEISLFLVDLDGRVRHQLHQSEIQAGSHKMSFVLPYGLSGVFFLTLLTESERFTEKVVLFKPD